jgi:hypothetical protein
VPISLFIVAYGGWTIKANLIVLSQNVILKYFELALVLLVFFVIPSFSIIFGFKRICTKRRVYLRGVRIVNDGIEIGTLTLDDSPVSTKKILAIENTDHDVSGEWKPKRKFSINAVNILIVVWKRQELPIRLFLERIVFSSRGHLLFQIFGNDIYLTQQNTLIFLSQGSKFSLGNIDGIYPDDILSFRKKFTNIVSGWKYSFALSCTLKTIPGLSSTDSVLAVGVLEGFNTTSTGNINDRAYQETFFDSLNT